MFILLNWIVMNSINKIKKHMKAIGKCLHGLNDDRDEGKIFACNSIAKITAWCGEWEREIVNLFKVADNWETVAVTHHQTKYVFMKRIHRNLIISSFLHFILLSLARSLNIFPNGKYFTLLHVRQYQIS